MEKGEAIIFERIKEELHPSPSPMERGLKNS